MMSTRAADAISATSLGPLSRATTFIVMPANAGILNRRSRFRQSPCSTSKAASLDPRFRGGDSLRQPHRRRRNAGDAFGAAGEAQALRRRRLDRDAADVEASDLGDAGAHGVAMRADLRGFADQR